MNKSSFTWIILCAAICLLWQLKTTHAAITWTGNIEPTDPTTWTTSTLGYVGKTNDGNLTVDGGSDLRSSELRIAYNPSVTGQVTVRGTGSSLVSIRQLDIGYQGNGSLTITDGGIVSNNSCYIGYVTDSTGEVTVNGANSRWLNSGLLYVGVCGHATLMITDGGLVQVRNDPSFMGYVANSISEVTVTGDDSEWSIGDDLFVGYAGSAMLTITNGGTVTTNRSTWVAFKESATGIVDFGPGGGILITQSLCASPEQFQGTGVVYTRGLISDIDLVFDSVSGLMQTLQFDSAPNQDITLHLDMSVPSNASNLGAGYRGSGSLVIRDGITVQCGIGTIGWQSGSTGVATVIGTGTRWTNTDSLGIGLSGEGSLEISDGGVVSNTYAGIGVEVGSNGSVDVRGTDSRWINSGNLYVGYSGTAALTITDGGIVTNNEGYIGYDPTSTSEVIVQGGDSKWINQSLLCVGFWGQGILTITDGGFVRNSLSYVGISSSSIGEVTVSGPGSTWTDLSGINIGYAGPGTLAITDGGFVSSTSGNLGYDTSATGEVSISGIGSNWDNSGPLLVGQHGHGRLMITDGGSIKNSLANLGAENGSLGEVTVSGTGSTWITDGNLIVGVRGSGMFAITDGGSVYTKKAYLGMISSAAGEVTVNGADSKWTNETNLYIGNAGSGTLTIDDGGLVSVGGLLTIDQNGGDDSFINITTGGMLALFGDADDSLTDFLNLINGTDAIRYWDDSISGWAAITDASYGDDYTLGYLSEGDLIGYTVLTVGDLKLNGILDGDDDSGNDNLTLWQAGFGLDSSGDADFDGDTDGNDFLIWQQQYDNYMAAVGNTAIPEPASRILILICAIFTLGQGHRKLT